MKNNDTYNPTKVKNTFGIEMPNWKEALKDVIGYRS